MNQLRINAVLTIAVLAATALLMFTALPLAGVTAVVSGEAASAQHVEMSEVATFAATGTPSAMAAGMAMWAPMS